MRILNYYFKYIKNVLSKELLFTTVFFMLFLGLFDYFDYGSKLFLLISTAKSMIVILAILVFAYLCLSPVLNKQFKLPFVNFIDKELLFLTISVPIYCLEQLWFTHNFLLWKIIIVIFCALVDVAVTIYRIYILFIKWETENAKNKHIYTLQELAENKIKNNSNEAILVKEEPVVYDLFNFKQTINITVDCIKAISKDDFFVIGIEGEWGSGKTTFANLLEEQIKDNFNVVKFSPWNYSNADSLLSGLFNKLCEANGYKYNNIHIKSVIRSFCATLPDSPNILADVMIDIMGGNQENSSELLQKYLSDICMKSSKQNVLFIDDLERADASNIIFLFKVIGNLLNTSNLIIFIIYDKERLDKILENNLQIDPHYYEKLINSVITIPKISSSEYRYIYCNCILNLVNAYTSDSVKIEEYKYIIDFLSDNSINIRTFIRIINSCFSKAFASKHILNKCDLVAIEVIKLLNPNLALEIYNNSRMFLEVDNYIYSVSEKDRNEYFASLEKEYSAYYILLYHLFPSFEKYIKSRKTKDYYLIKDKPIRDGDYRIYDFKYFDLFFSLGTNDHVRIHENVMDVVHKINESDSNSFNTFYEIYKQNDLSDYLSEFNRYCSEIKEEHRIEFANILLDHYFEFSNTYKINRKTPDQYLIADIIVNLVMLADYTDFSKFVNDKLTYENLIVFYRLKMQLKYTKNNIKSLNEKAKLIENKFSGLCNSIIKDNIDIFNEHYKIGNLSVLGEYYLSDPEARKYKEEFLDYIKRVLNSNNIYMILDACSSTMTSDNCAYCVLAKDELNEYSLEYTQLKPLVDKHHPVTDYEKLLSKALELGKDKSFGFNTVSDRGIKIDFEMEHTFKLK